MKNLPPILEKKLTKVDNFWSVLILLSLIVTILFALLLSRNEVFPYLGSPINQNSNDTMNENCVGSREVNKCPQHQITMMTIRNLLSTRYRIR